MAWQLQRDYYYWVKFVVVFQDPSCFSSVQTSELNGDIMRTNIPAPFRAIKATFFLTLRIQQRFQFPVD